MSYFVIGDEETVIGFRLTGIEGRSAHTPYETRQALKVATSTEGVNIILITERLAQGIRDELERHESRHFPLILAIPDRKGPIEGRLSIREMIKAAVGVKL